MKQISILLLKKFSRGFILLLILSLSFSVRLLHKLLRLLSGEKFCEESATVQEIQDEYQISRRKAYKIYRKHHMSDLEKARQAAIHKRDALRASLSSSEIFKKFRFESGTDGTLVMKPMEH